MGPKTTHKPVAQQVVRIGEGHAVDVALMPSKGGAASQYAIDTSGLPVPDRRLSCDTVSLVKTDHVVKLLFAQKNAVTEGYLSVLVIQMSFEAVSNFIHNLNHLNTSIEELEKQGKLLRGALTEIRDKPDQSAVVTASMVMAGYSGNDGCLDFYYVSPFSIQRINLGNKVAVEAVVRVQLPTPLMVALIRALAGMAPTLPAMNSEVNS